MFILCFRIGSLGRHIQYKTKDKRKYFFILTEEYICRELNTYLNKKIRYVYYICCLVAIEYRSTCSFFKTMFEIKCGF